MEIKDYWVVDGEAHQHSNEVVLSDHDEDEDDEDDEDDDVDGVAHQHSWYGMVMVEKLHFQ